MQILAKLCQTIAFTIKSQYIISFKKIKWLTETHNTSKKWPWTFDGFQTKPLRKLEILQKLLLLKVFFTYVIKTQNHFFVTELFNIFMSQTLTNDFWRLHKNKNCMFPSKFCLGILPPFFILWSLISCTLSIFFIFYLFFYHYLFSPLSLLLFFCFCLGFA